MLLTMQDAYKDEFIAMPNPERVDKVEDSMENLEEVVRERKKAFYQLEVGVSGERERVHRQNCFGRVVPYKKREHAMPYHMNTSYRQKLRLGSSTRAGRTCWTSRLGLGRRCTRVRGAWRTRR